MTLSHVFLLKTINFTITIVVFRVLLDISQSSLNMMEIQHLTMWTLSWKSSQQPSSCNKKLWMEFLPRKHSPIETSSHDSYSFTRILHWYKKCLFCLSCSCMPSHLLSAVRKCSVINEKSEFLNLSIYSAHFTTPSPQQHSESQIMYC